jgi:enterochelin esterase-like enzyme
MWLFRRGVFVILLLVASIGSAGCTKNMSASAHMLATPTFQFAGPLALTTATAAATATLPHAQIIIIPYSPTPTSTPVALSTSTATPVPTASPTPSNCLIKGGRIIRDYLVTDLLPLSLNFRVYLPPCYDQQPERRYPVLYLFHGQSYNDDQWDRLGVDEVEDRLVAAGEMAPFIIVMPRDRNGGQPTENNFAKAIADVLVPYIDQTYRTLPDRNHRAVGGLSRGAGWAIHLGLTHWQMFGVVGGHSPAIFYSDAQVMRALLDAIPLGAFPRIYLDIGDKDRDELMTSTLWFEKLLNEAGIPHEWYLFSGYHEESYWRAHVEDYLRWYALEWTTESNSH